MTKTHSHHHDSDNDISVGDKMEFGELMFYMISPTNAFTFFAS